MCGVLYFKGNSKKHKQLVINLLEQSRIRGLHAFGLAIRNSPEESFRIHRSFTLQEAKDFLRENEFWELIGHTRYDTSGNWKVMENNQPVAIGGNLLVFNGVIRMCSKEEYEKEFSRTYVTENDGEILMDMYSRAKVAKAEKLLGEEAVSFAGVIHVNNKSVAVRNSRRPLWIYRQRELELVFSTRDIFFRAVETLKGTVDIDLTSVAEIAPMEEVCL